MFLRELVHTGCDPSAKRFVAGAIITAKVTDSDTLVFEPYYANESNASRIRALAGQSPNARWDGLGTYWIHDFNDQMQPHAFSLPGSWRNLGGCRWFPFLRGA